MALGAHELLLIVRAQNQASAALGRVANDIRRLQRMRDLKAQQTALINKAAMQTLRIAQVESSLGTKNLSIQREQLAVQNQIAAVNDRDVNLMQRRAAILSRGTQIIRQEERLRRSIDDLEGKGYAIRTRQLRTDQQILATQEKMARLAPAGPVRNAAGQFLPAAQRLPAGIDRQAAMLTEHRAVTAQMAAEQRLRMVSKSETASPESVEIAKRRAKEAEMSVTLAKSKTQALDVALKDLARTENIQRRSLTELTHDFQDLGREEGILQKKIEDLQLSWNQLSARERSVQAAEAQHIRQLTDLEMRMTGVRSKAMEMAAALEVEKSALEQTNIALAETNKLIANERVERIAGTARAVSHLGRVMQLTGLIGSAAFGVMAKQAADFSTESTLAATQAGYSLDSVSKHSASIQKQTLQLMSQFPASSQDVTTAFYDIYSSMDVTDKQATHLMQGFEKLSVAGMAPLNDVTNAGITIMNDFADAAKNPDAALNQILATVRFGRTNLQQYTTTLNQLVPAFKNAGQSSLQMNAALAETTRLMPSQRMSGTGLARLTEMFTSPAFAQGAKSIGIAVRDAGNKMLPFNQIIHNIATSTNPLAKGLHNGTVSAQQFFKALTGTAGTIQGRRVFISLIDNSKELDLRLKQLAGDKNELDRSFKAISQSPGVQWAIFTNQLKALLIVIGQGVIPALVQMSAPLVKVIRYIESLSPHTKRLIGYFGFMVAASTLLIGTLGVLAGSFIAMGIAARPLIAIFANLGGRGGVAALSTDVGAVTVEMIAFRASLVVAIPLLLAFHTQILHAVTGSNGLAGALKLLSIVLAGLALRSLIVGLVTMIPLLMEAATATGVLSTAIIGLEAASVAEIAIAAALGYALSRLINMIPGWGKAFHWFGGQIYDAFHSTPKELPSSSVMQKQIRQITDRFWELRKAGMSVKNIRIKISTQFAGMDPHELKVFLDNAAKNPRSVFRPQTNNKLDNLPAAITQGPQAVGARTPGDVSATGLGVWNMAQFRARIDIVKKLKIASDALPNSIPLLTKYHHALDTLTAHSSALQKELISDLLNVKGVASSMTDAQFQRQAARVDALGKKAAKTNNFQDAKKYYNALDKLNSDSTSAQQEAWQSTHQAASDSLKATVKDSSQALQTISSNYQTMLGTIKSSFSSFQSQNQSAMGTLFSGPFVNSAKTQNNLQWGGKLTGKDLLTDLKSQVSQFRQFRRVLDQLNKRGVPYELLTQIQAMGPEALPSARALLSLNQHDFRTYTKVFKKGQSLVDQATKVDMSRQLKHWRTFGQNIARQILLGLRDERSPMDSYFRGLLKSAGVAPKIPGKGGGDEKYVQYVYNGGTMDYSTWLRKSKNHYKKRGK